MGFFKKLFCIHHYPRIVYNTECSVINKCWKCDKTKKVDLHEYKCVGERVVAISLVSGFPREIKEKLYRCDKCLRFLVKRG